MSPKTDLEILLRLPTIMDNYSKRYIKNLKDILQDSLKITNRLTEAKN